MKILNIDRTESDGSIEHVKKFGTFTLALFLFATGNLNSSPKSFHVRGYTIDVMIQQSEVPGYSVFSATASTKKTGKKTLHVELKWEDSPIPCMLLLPLENGAGSVRNVPCRTGKNTDKFELLLIKEYEAHI